MPTSAFLQLAFLLAALAAGLWRHAASMAAPEFNLIHRDHLAGGHLTQEELVARMLTRDTVRMEGALSAAHRGQTPLPPSYGEFLATILAGSPPQPVALIMDTTSEITWMKCAFNNRTLIKTKTFFNNYNSTTYISETCNNPAMTCRPDVEKVLNNTQLWCRSSGDCVYNAGYRDETISSDIALETFIINHTTTGKPMRVKKLRFACTHIAGLTDLDSVLGPAAYGVLALGPGPASFASQVPNVSAFSYCLSRQRNSSGKLIFGEVLTSEQKNCTDLGTAGVNRTLYELNVEKIQVDKTQVRIGAGNWIVDLSQSFTSLPAGIYDAVVKKLDNWLHKKYRRIDSTIPMLEHCYSIGSGIERADLPYFAIGFKNGAVFEPGRVSLVVETGPGEMCLGFVKNSVEPGPGVIGNLLQRDSWLQFGKKKMCFARAVNCTG